MSKRKETEDLDNLNEFPAKRSCLYENIYIKIQANQEELRKTGLELQKLSESVEDYLTLEAIEHLEDAIKKCEQVRASLKKSQKSWISFDCLPDIPLDHILSYLNFKDKSNLRLISKNTMKVVDRLDKSFQTLNFNTFNNRFESHPLLLQSNKNVKFNLSAGFGEQAQECFQQVIDRIVKISANLDDLEKPQFSNLNLLNSIESLHLEKGYNTRIVPATFMKCVKNLTSLELYNVSLEDFGKETFKLPQIKILKLSRVGDSEGFQNLLSSCSANLEQVEFMNLVMEFKTLSFDFPKLTNLTLESCSHQFLLLLKDSTSNLKNIKLENTKPFFLTNIDFFIGNVKNLKLKYARVFGFKPYTFSEEDRSGLLKLFEKAAVTVENLHLEGLADVLFTSDVPVFPNLKKLVAKSCNSLLQTDIILQSPNLKQLGLDDKCQLIVEEMSNHTNEVEHLSIARFQDKDAFDFDPVTENMTNLVDCLAEFSSSLKYFTVSHSCIKNWPPTDFTFMHLKKLSLKNCSVQSGFDNMLKACCSTLEELQVSDEVELEKELTFEMPKLKRVVIDGRRVCSTSSIARMEILSLLLNQSSALEKLAISLPGNTKAATSDIETLKRCHLPNLKVLQIYPKPSSDLIKTLKKNFSENMTFWFFPWRTEKDELIYTVKIMAW